MPLVRAEVLRLLSRRIAWIFAVIVVLIALLVTVRGFLVSNRDLAGAQRRAAAQVERNEREQPGYNAMIQQQCEAERSEGFRPPDADCDPVALSLRDPRLSAKDSLPGGARGVAGSVALVVFLVGASFIGAEWNHGTLQALLFWEPRRGRVLVAKALALVGVVVAFTALLQAFVYGMTYLTAATRGTTDGLTAGVQMSVLLTILRGFVVVSVTALLGYAVAGLARFTAAALGVGLAYFVIIENLIRGLRPGWQRYLFSENVGAILLKETQVAPAGAGSLDEVFNGEAVLYTLTGVRGAITLTIYLGLLLGVFYFTFTRRDVT